MPPAVHETGVPHQSFFPGHAEALLASLTSPLRGQRGSCLSELSKNTIGVIQRDPADEKDGFV